METEPRTTHPSGATRRLGWLPVWGAGRPARRAATPEAASAGSFLSQGFGFFRGVIKPPSSPHFTAAEICFYDFFFYLNELKSSPHICGYPLPWAGCWRRWEETEHLAHHRALFLGGAGPGRQGPRRPARTWPSPRGWAAAASADTQGRGGVRARRRSERPPRLAGKARPRPCRSQDHGVLNWQPSASYSNSWDLRPASRRLPVWLMICDS